MSYLILFGIVSLAGALSVKVGELVGKLADSTFAAALMSFLLYSGLLFVGCWLLFQSIPPIPQGVDPHLAELNAQVKAQSERWLIQFGVTCWLVGGSFCAAIPIWSVRSRRLTAQSQTLSGT